LFILAHYLEQNLHSGLVPENQFGVSRGQYWWTGSTPALFQGAFRMHGTEKEIISKNFQFGTKDSHVRFIIYYLVRIVHFMGRILVLEKVFEMILVIKL